MKPSLRGTRSGSLRAVLAQRPNLDDCNAETINDYELDSFSDSTCDAISLRVYKAFDEWGCLRQPKHAAASLEAGPPPWRVQVYALDCEYENNLLVTVRRDGGPLVQLSTLTLDADGFVDDLYGRKGPQLLIDVLEAVLYEANLLIDNAHTVAAVPVA